MPRSIGLVILAAVLVMVGAWFALEEQEAPLGPVDEAQLPPADTGRVAVGDPAPDFALMSREGERIRLSDFQGEKDVVLVFYRGHW